MKRILIVDPLSYSGHVNYNHGVIRSIATNYDYSVIVNKATSLGLQKKGIPQDKFPYIYPDSWNIDNLSKRMGKIWYHLAFRLFFIRVILYARKNVKKYDSVIFTCIDVYSFALVSWLFGRNCYVVDHGIGNLPVSSIYRIGWKLINKKIQIIVLEQIIKEMVEKVLPNRTIHVVRHPLPSMSPLVVTHEIKNNEMLLFAPSGSNDEDFLHGLCNVKFERLRVVARSNTFEFKNDRVTIYKEYLSNEDYNNNLSNADFILLPYSDTYNYRVSAVLFEAMVLGKPVALLSNNTLREYGAIFSGKICLFSSLSEMERVVESFITTDSMPSSFNLYKDCNLASTFASLFN